jgi:hypothetical protein
MHNKLINFLDRMYRNKNSPESRSLQLSVNLFVQVLVFFENLFSLEF